MSRSFRASVKYRGWALMERLKFLTLCRGEASGGVVSVAITLTVTSKGQITLREEMLAHLDARAGGDFADESIVSQGARLGGTAFASFDHAAVARLRAQGANAVAPADLVA